MKTCRNCHGTKIKSRTNSTHGKNSKGMTTFSCKKCGSTDIEVKTNDNNRFNKPRRKK